MTIEAHQLLSFTAGGLVNGVTLAAVVATSDYRFLSLLLFGIVGYGLMEITRRIYYRIFTPDANPLSNKLGIFRVESWKRWIVWGLLNGALFYLFYPYVSFSYPLTIVLGVVTVHVRDIILFIYKKVMKQRAVTSISSAFKPRK